MASYQQEDELVNFYGSGIADMNEEDEEMIDITTEVRYMFRCLNTKHVCSKLAPVKMYSFHFRNQKMQIVKRIN